ncbi:hypothetical protein PR003_g25689 [Phytophthora rubi]|uniref:Uncharacterized protein n=1 Tax=Phytophthora rubi TaxID=129364 RepID=A0A6A3HPP6_9STRA|nr:hypothetical protein PR001_g26921 [Phytophthora rubi]KAE9288913.1 hypothetical protein PR003_g25689 [Phytophthora rubi]
MTLNSVQKDVVEEEQEGKDDGTPLDAKADGHVVSSPAQHRDAADQVEPPPHQHVASAALLVQEPARPGRSSSAWQPNNTVQVLELDACDLVGSAYRPQHEGILALSKGLQSVRSRLRFVNVACNDLQPQGCRILLGALSFHKTLTALDISDNMLGLFNDKQGYLALSYLLQYSKQLCWLSISDNPLPPAAGTALSESLSSNHSLTSLYASRCGLSREQWLTVSSTGQSGSARQKKTRRPGGLFHTLEC